MSVLPGEDIHSAPLRRRRKLVIPLALWAVLSTGLGYLFLTSSEPEPSAPMGASVPVPGGMASITGITPLESDRWRPPEPSDALGTRPQEGSHRVRIQVQFTALDNSGLRYDPAQYSVEGIGSGEPEALWTSPGAHNLDRGESMTATMIFELPDKAIALVLENDAGSRLSLGSEHHQG